jgi:serine/threonine-protein kinase
LRPGDTLRKKFLIEGVIGSGGMGTVYQAVHVRMQKRVAIKVLDGSRATHPANVSRFGREALAAARLRGPHAVRVYDVDMAESGEPFLVMELLRGRELSTALTEHNHPRETLVDWGIQICSAIQEAHDLGIIHRDLKPSNIFVMERTNQIKIVDFGISKVQDSMDITTDSQILGTPKYMSPEQLQAKPVGPPSDIWAIGIILYRMLSGAHPFPFPKGAPPFVFAASTLTQEPVPLREVAPALPGELTDTVMKCLRKPAAERWQTARDLARRLEPFGSGQVGFEEIAVESSALRTATALIPEEGLPIDIKRSSLPPTFVEVYPNSGPLVTREPLRPTSSQMPDGVSDGASRVVRRPWFSHTLYAGIVVLTLVSIGLYAFSRWAVERHVQPVGAGSNERASPDTTSTLEPLENRGETQVPPASSDIVTAEPAASSVSRTKSAPIRPTAKPPVEPPPTGKPRTTAKDNPLFL